ncbi:Hypothetical predicted protein [Cloeon dipterum]|uniref:Uncharacterized protein n=1 Tax=Cloeon dipterum TaxID=197152 RepID=A0A8S1DI33_9INSE|nr:Hypothetical predicted protein [Cloeon dipterum]
MAVQADGWPKASGKSNFRRESVNSAGEIRAESRSVVDKQHDILHFGSILGRSRISRGTAWCGRVRVAVEPHQPSSTTWPPPTWRDRVLAAPGKGKKGRITSTRSTSLGESFNRSRRFDRFGPRFTGTSANNPTTSTSANYDFPAEAPRLALPTRDYHL